MRKLNFLLMSFEKDDEFLFHDYFPRKLTIAWASKKWPRASIRSKNFLFLKYKKGI